MNSLDRFGKIRVLGFSVFVSIILIFARNIPFFWDMSYISKISNYILDVNFTKIIFPGIDNGTPPLFSLYFAALFKIFGKSLLVSHLAITPFVVIIFSQYQILLNRFVNKRFHTLAFVILIAEPAFSAQVLFSGYDIVLTALIMTAANAILKNNKLLLGIALIAIPLLSNRGFSFVVALLIADFLINCAEKASFKNIAFRLIPYFICFLIYALWLTYYWCITGWFVVPAQNKFLMSAGGIEWIFRNLFYIVWKITDSGRIALFLMIGSLLFYTRKSKNTIDSNKLIVFIFSIVITYILIFAALKPLVSQRHFIAVYVFSILLFFNLIEFSKPFVSKLLISVLLFCFIGGNFIMYPERFGNAWDSSLKSLPYFKFENELHDFVIKEKIDPSTIAAQFPMNFDRRFTHLENNSFAYTDIDSRPLAENSYVVFSNISNSFSPECAAELNKNWVLLKQFQSGPVYIRLYKNPGITDK